MKIYNENNVLINHNRVEHIEQGLAKKYIKPEDRVLELGARYGSVSIITNQIVNDKETHYVVEPDASVWNALENNMKANNCSFNIIKGTISQKKYSLTNPKDGYAKRTVIKEDSSIETFELPDVDFNVLIADCEGFLETFYDENKDLFKRLDKLIVEFDQPKHCDYERLKTEFNKLGFVIKEEIKIHGLYHYVYEKKKSMLFCSLSDRPSLSQPMFETLQSYCDKHEYKCVLENNSLDTTRYPSWSKIKLLQREMKANPDIDTIVWMDDDILITNQDIKFEELIKDYPYEHILVSADVIYSPFNAGIMVVKNDESTYQLLQYIYDMCDQEEYQYYKFNGLWEQDVMVKYCRNVSLMNPNQECPVTIIPHNIIQSFHRDHTLSEENKWKVGHFSAHFTGMSLEKRIQYRDEVLKTI